MEAIDTISFPRRTNPRSYSYPTSYYPVFLSTERHPDPTALYSLNEIASDRQSASHEIKPRFFA